MRLILFASCIATIPVLTLPLSAQDAQLQENAENVAKAPVEIPDEPKTVDPSQFVPEALAKKVTVDFSDSSIRELVTWLAEEQGLPVLFDKEELARNGISPGTPIDDWLNDQPIYLLLDRLEIVEIGWFVDSGIIHLTDPTLVEERLFTEPYNISDLLDDGLKASTVIETLMNSTPGPWFRVDGVGGVLEHLGDVLFIRQTLKNHRQVGGVLAAIRNHARRTFAGEPPEHIESRQALSDLIDVNFDETPLVEAIAILADKSGVDIRLDSESMTRNGIKEREPVSLRLAGRSLETVIDVLLFELQLTWTLQHGVMWITPMDLAEEVMKTAIYDVRDLAADESEMQALTDAIGTQSEGPWFDIDGVGGTMEAPRPGTLVIRADDRTHQDVLELLETFRKALLNSKPRKPEGPDPDEVLTVYYRLDTAIATDLSTMLPLLLKDKAWDEAAQPAQGILVLSAGEVARDLNGQPVTSDKQKPVQVVEMSAMVITQPRRVQLEIAEIIRKINEGTSQELLMPFGADSMEGYGGGNMGGGGFGGGFFRIPVQ